MNKKILELLQSTEVDNIFLAFSLLPGNADFWRDVFVNYKLRHLSIITVWQKFNDFDNFTYHLKIKEPGVETYTYIPKGLIL